MKQFVRASRWIFVVVAVAGLVWLATRGLINRQPPPPPAAKALPAAQPPQRVAPSPPTPEPVTTSAVVTNPPPVNAADLYRQAFAALDALTKEEKGLLADWKTNAVAPELCAKLQPIVALAHQAGTNCNWGVRFEGLSTLLPHLSQARQLVRALLWNAAHCRQDDAAGVSEDLLATLRAGQNASEFLIGHLVNTAIQRMTSDYLAENAHTLPAATLAELAQAFSDEQYDASFYRGIEAEARGADFEADRFAASTNSIDAIFQMMGRDDNPLANLSKEQIIAKMREVAAFEREYVSVIGRSEAEYQAWLARLQLARQSNPLIEMFTPALGQALETTRAMVVQRAMMVAGIQVLVAGPSVLTQYLDPSTGQPFKYQPTATGFQLTSIFQRNGQPVSLNFRQ